MPSPLPDGVYFYHVMELPTYGVVGGQWDLRNAVGDYLGNVDVSGWRCLDVGTADGFLAFELERRGAAEVLGLDLTPALSWDVVPSCGIVNDFRVGRNADAALLNRAFELAKADLHSSAQFVPGTIYDVEHLCGTVDYSIVGSILLHVRDPLGALSSVAQATRRRLVVTDMYPSHLPARGEPMAYLLAGSGPRESWWYLTPSLVAQWLGALGFRTIRQTTHDKALYGHEARQLWTVIASRE